MAEKVTIGSVWGNLEVLSDGGYYTEPGGRRRRKFNLKCLLCGDVFGYPASYLARTAGKKGYGLTSCKKCHVDKRRVVQVGDVFDQLTVIGYECRRDGRTRDTAVCRCSCGQEIQVRLTGLQTNKTNNCGCRVRGKWRGHGDLSRTYFRQIERGAVSRDLAFDVTIEQLWGLFQQQAGKCAMTGLEIKLGRRPEMLASLDRIDSSQGYKLSNVQWVHPDVNLMKMDLPLARFLELCRLVAQQP